MLLQIERHKKPLGEKPTAFLAPDGNGILFLALAKAWQKKI